MESDKSEAWRYLDIQIRKQIPEGGRNLWKLMRMKLAVVVIICFMRIKFMEGQKCENMIETCAYRHELQFDFSYVFHWNCTVVPNCICHPGIDMEYFEFPPYIMYNSKKKEVAGILKGEFFK